MAPHAGLKLTADPTRMHIALFIERLDPCGGGQERTTIQLAQHLIRRGHRITFLTGDAPPFVEIDGAVIRNGHTLDFKHHVKPVAFARWARNQLESLDSDVSLSVTSLAPADVIMPLTGTVRERVNRAKQLHHGTRARAIDNLKLALNPRAQAMLRLERSALADKRVRRVVAVSSYVRTQLLQHELVGDERVSLIRLGVELPILAAAERAAARQSVRRGFNVADGVTAFLLVSHHPMWKGAAALLRAVKPLIERGRPAVILFAGHISYAQQRLAADLGLRDHVRMIGPTERMAPLYSAADVTVSATIGHACSRVTLESLAMGLPVITTAFDGAAEWLSEAEGGGAAGVVIDDPHNVAALTAAMEAMLDPSRRRRHGEAAASLRPRLAMERFVDELEQILSP